MDLANLVGPVGYFSLDLYCLRPHKAGYQALSKVVIGHSRRMMKALSGEKPFVTTRQPAALLSESTRKSKLDSEGLARLAMRLSTTLGSISEAFVTLDLKGRFTYLNHESERLLQLESADLLGNEIWTVLDDTVNERLRWHIEQALSTNRRVELEDFYAALGKWLELRVHPFAEGLAIYFRDVTDRKLAEEKIHHLAFYDPLTELPNRQLLLDRLTHALTDSAITAEFGALMFIDLDNFKVLNDTLGHPKGDLLLQKVAARLKACVRKNDTVARLGGDEFVVMLQNLGGDAEAAARKAQVVADKVLVTLREPHDLAGHQHYSTGSIGVTPFTAQQADVSDLLKQADLAMYHAKNLGRNTVCFFDPAMQAIISASAALSADLRAGLREQQFVVHYQPQVDAQRRMVGVEALLRWQHPERGVVDPSEFIPVAEETGLIVPLGHWVLEQACQQLALWSQTATTAGLSMAVNVSVRQFRDPDFVDTVMALIKKTGIRPQKLKLELTESLLADRMEVTLAKMGTLKALGVTLALDDFGMGYSSLSYLNRLPLNQLKIDKSFVADVSSDPRDAAISRAIIFLAHSMGLEVMAEGVETEAQMQFLAAQGCGYFQGYLFSPPLPIAQLDSYMRDQPVVVSPSV